MNHPALHQFIPHRLRMHLSLVAAIIVIVVLSGPPPVMSQDTPQTAAAAALQGEDSAPFDPVVQDIEGWTVHVDPALLEGEHSEIGRRALRMLADNLNRVVLLVSADKLKELRELEIWIEHHHPTLGAMQYHPSRRWLVGNGHDPRLTRKVHIPRAAALYDREQLRKHPFAVLHELAHAYHDQKLGFDDPSVIDVFEKAKQEGIYEKVLLYTGKTVRHYALTNHKEYFAESTEAYFGRNDFFPFVRAELAQYDPRMHALLEGIWGKIR